MELRQNGLKDPNSQLADNASKIANLKKDRVSVLDFGADPTGVNDSTVAIQNAINSLTTNANSTLSVALSGSGGIVYLPPGVYKVSTLIMKSNVHIYGAGSTV